MAQKAYLSDAVTRRAAFASKAAGSYRIVDSGKGALGGFYLHVGQDSKTFRLQVDVPDPNAEGKRKRRTLGFSWAWPATPADEARLKAREILDRRDRGEALTGPNDAITVLQAWDSYKALMEKKRRSAATIKVYEHMVACLKPLQQTALRDVTRGDATELHNKLTAAGHPYLANATMRMGHALYNHAAKDLEKPLPALNPFRGRNLHNKETRSKVDFEESDLPGWFKQLQAFKSPIWREWFWLVMLTGLRRRTVAPMRVDHVHFGEGYIEIPAPKGGEERAFKVPMSKAMRRSLHRAIRAGAPLRGIPKCAPWVFPSARSASGHVEEPKSQPIDTSSKDQRHIYILFANGAGVVGTHQRVLTNHKIARDVHDEYMNVDSMFDQLREAQERISTYILKHGGKGAEATLERLLKRDLTPKVERAAA